MELVLLFSPALVLLTLTLQISTTPHILAGRWIQTFAGSLYEYPAAILGKAPLLHAICDAFCIGLGPNRLALDSKILAAEGQKLCALSWHRDRAWKLTACCRW